MVNSYFNLTEDPFSVTSDARFFYNSEGHEEALAHLVFGLKQRKGFLALTGEVGAGKTTLLNALLDQLDDSWKHAFVYNSKVGFLELLRFVLYDLGIPDPPEQKVECIRALNAYLLQAAEAGHEVVVIIDEAQNLTPETLEEIRLLSNLETYSRKLLQIVFAGQPEFGGILNGPSLAQLNQRVAIRYHLGALKPAETAEYIAHRLKVAGAADAALFHPAALQLIHRATRGIPRLINQVCSVALLQTALGGKRRVTEEIVRQVLETEFSSHGEVAGGLRVQPAAAGWWSWKGLAAGLGLAVVGLGALLTWTWLRPGTSTAAPEMLPAPLLAEVQDNARVPLDTLAQAATPPEAHADSLPAATAATAAAASRPAGDPVLPSPRLKEPSEGWRTESVLVEPGESITSILMARYGMASWEMVQVVKDLNPQVADPNIIRRGTLLKIPVFTTTKATEPTP